MAEWWDKKAKEAEASKGFGGIAKAAARHLGDSLPIGATDYAVDNLANQLQMSIEITHIISGKTVSFPAFVSEFKDSFESGWTEEQAYGRMDPLSTYTGTVRRITASWVVPSFSAAEAVQNLAKVALLEQFLYPSYTSKAGGALTIKSAPLLRVKFANLIMNAKTGGGLLGYVSGFSTSPNLDLGVHMEGDNIIPKELSLDFSFTPLHEHELGWDDNGEFRGDLQQGGFPYAQNEPSADPLNRETTPEEIKAAANAAVMGTWGTD